MNDKTTNAYIELTEQWEKQKEEMGVSAAEYVRRMVRVGHRQYGYPYDPDEIPEMYSIKTEDDQQGKGNLVRQFLINNLSSREYTSLEELVALLEEEIEETAKDLERQGIVESSFSEGGFTLNENWRDKMGETDD
jgi:hypothetical protein